MTALPADIAKAISDLFAAGSEQQGFFGHPTWYPLQFKEAPSAETNHGSGADDTQTATYFGELRGFYPSRNGYFQPWNSAFHETSNTTTNDLLRYRRHKGLDLYAPYFPHPLEIPVYTIIDAEISQRSQFSRWNSLGNRADLHFSVTVGGQTHRYVLVFGHLSRFAPIPEGRRATSPTTFEIKSGDLIGYIGKSGNADRDLESSGNNLEFRVNAAHIHLAVRQGKRQYDPYPLLAQRFGYHPDRDELFPGGGNVELESKGKHLTTAVFGERLRDNMPGAVAVSAALQAGSVPGLRVSQQQPDDEGNRPSRVPFPGVFRAIDTNNSKHLKATERAYQLSHDRLTSNRAANIEHIRYALFGPTDPSVRPTIREPWFASYLAAADDTAWGDTLQDYTERARMHAANVADNAKADQRAWHLCAALHVLHESLWVLMLGPAFQGFCRGWAAQKNGGEPQTGIGLRGRVLATQFQESVVGLHISSIPRADNTAQAQVYSVTFGSGGLRHATLPAPDSLPASATAERDFITLVISQVFRPLCQIHSNIRTFTTELGGLANATVLKDWIDTLADRTSAGGSELAPTPLWLLRQVIQNDDRDFFKPVAAVNAELFRVAHGISLRRDNAAPIPLRSAPPHQPDLEWIGHSGDLTWTKDTGEERYG